MSLYIWNFTFELVHLTTEHGWVIVNIININYKPTEWCFALCIWRLHLVLVLLFDYRIFQINKGFGSDLSTPWIHLKELIFSLLDCRSPCLHWIVHMLTDIAGCYSCYSSTNWNCFIYWYTEYLFLVGKSWCQSRDNMLMVEYDERNETYKLTDKFAIMGNCCKRGYTSG